MLLRSSNVALVLSFLGRVFVDNNASNLPATVLTAELDEELYALNQRLGEDRFPKPAADYLDDWARRTKDGCASTTRRVRRGAL